MDVSYSIAKKTQILVQLSYQSFQPDLQEIRQEIEPKLSGPGTVSSIERSCSLGMISLSLVQALPWKGFRISAGVDYYSSIQRDVQLKIANYNYTYQHKEKWHYPNGVGVNFGMGMDLIRGQRLGFVFELNGHAALDDVKHTIWIQLLTGLRYCFTKTQNM